MTCTTNNHSRRQTEVFCTSQTPKNVVGSFLVSLYTLRIKPHILHPSLCAMRPLLQTLTGPQHSNPAPYTLKSNSAEERRCWPLPLEPLSRSSAFQSGGCLGFLWIYPYSHSHSNPHTHTREQGRKRGCCEGGRGRRNDRCAPGCVGVSGADKPCAPTLSTKNPKTLKKQVVGV